jgi:uncharacterized membrane protein
VNKVDFLKVLEKKLSGVNDKDDIISEYEDHFRMKCADGYSEEEIAKKLGDPAAIAKQFEEGTVREQSGKSRFVAAIGLAGADLMLFLVAIPLAGGIALLFASAFAFVSGGVVLIIGQNARFSIPYIPYGAALLFALALLALSVLASLAAWYMSRFFRQFLRAYGRWHKNTWGAAASRPVYPPLPFYPQTAPKLRRHIRTVLMASTVAFIVAMAIGYTVSALSAGNMEFWHIWKWFI